MIGHNVKAIYVGSVVLVHQLNFPGGPANSYFYKNVPCDVNLRKNDKMYKLKLCIFTNDYNFILLKHNRLPRKDIALYKM